MKTTWAQTKKTRRRLTKRKNRKRRKKITKKRLQIGRTTTRTEIIRIKRMFIFFATAWLKNWKVIYWLLTRKIKHKHLVKVRSFSGRKNQLYDGPYLTNFRRCKPGSYYSTCRHKRFKNWKYSQPDYKSYNRSSDITEKCW